MSCVKLIGKKAESYFCKFLCMFMIFFFLYDRGFLCFGLNLFFSGSCAFVSS